jgi:hypothetical protein
MIEMRGPSRARIRARRQHALISPLDHRGRAGLSGVRGHEACGQAAGRAHQAHRRLHHLVAAHAAAHLMVVVAVMKVMLVRVLVLMLVLVLLWVLVLMLVLVLVMTIVHVMVHHLLLLLLLGRHQLVLLVMTHQVGLWLLLLVDRRWGCVLHWRRLVLLLLLAGLAVCARRASVVGVLRAGARGRL